MTQTGASPPSIAALRKAYSITSSARPSSDNKIALLIAQSPAKGSQTTPDKVDEG
jgi:hypothetical protein